MVAKKYQAKRGRPSASQRPRKRRFLVVTNGEVTERQYFKGLQAELGDVVIDVRSDKADPASLAKYALGLAKREGGSSKKRDDEGFQAIYVVTDVDQFTSAQFKIASATCSKAGMELIVSNPCFEVWLVDHLASCPESHTEARDVERRAAELKIVSGSRNKHVEYSCISGKGREACANARRHNTSRRAAKRALLDDMRFAPWTDMPEVFERMSG